MNSEKYSVFVSHSSKDAKLAKQVTDILESGGLKCWIAPRDIPAGSSYGEEIAQAIEKVSLFLLILTEDSNLSTPVANEVERAFSYQKTIVPLRIRAVAPSKKIEYYISSSQWVDAFASPLADRLQYIGDVVRSIEQNARPPALPSEVKTVMGRVYRFCETIGRNPIGFSMGFVSIVLLGIITGLFFKAMAPMDNAQYNAVQQRHFNEVRCVNLMGPPSPQRKCDDTTLSKAEAYWKKFGEIRDSDHSGRNAFNNIEKFGNRLRLAIRDENFSEAERVLVEYKLTIK